MYKQLRNNETTIVRLSDNAFIPIDPGNRDYQEYLDWIEQGNTIQPADVPPITVNNIVKERERRLTLGFDYNFNDVRGIHHIGTTENDMIGWDEVTKFANALISTGNGAQLLTIVTDTGPVQLTALEWQGVLIAAGMFRQPIWAASFYLQTLDPIPANYTNDMYWA